MYRATTALRLEHHTTLPRLFYIGLVLFSLQATSQTVLLRENFNDGNLSVGPPWEFFFTPGLITSDSTHYHSPGYSCRVSTNNQMSAIEAFTRIPVTPTDFEISEYIYIDSLVDEAIPLFARGKFTSFILFFLPGGKVQLTVMKDSLTWDPVDLVVANGYATKKWQLFAMKYDGVGTLSLAIDSVFKGSVNQKLMCQPSVVQIGNRYLPHTSTFYVDDITVMTNASLPPPGSIYFTYCSDTGTWDGMDVNNYLNLYTYTIFSGPTRNAATVINPDFRKGLTDGEGRPMPFTWYMMDGSMNARNTNADVVHPWIANLEMMTRFRGTAIARVGDELSFHYHNFIWNDPDKDGVFHWNQTTAFDLYRDDFLKTLGHIILDGRRMPTSFRSGWHYMDNQWEALIDSLIPYRFENTSPDKNDDTTEPIDNIYDWSRASLEWVPYHPSSIDYQVSGDLRGWESRCVYMGSAGDETVYEQFSKAASGVDEVVTLWSHLPDDQFPNQITHCDSIVHRVAQYFPEVKYFYTTATEAMRRWRHCADTTPPHISATAQIFSDSVILHVETNEPLWQRAPIVVVKAGLDTVVWASPRISEGRGWDFVLRKKEHNFERAGIAATDTSGNAAVELVDLVPTHVSGSTEVIPERYFLSDAYPNPFNISANIKFSVRQSAQSPAPGQRYVTLKLYDLLGREVRTFVEGMMADGVYSVPINGSGLESGVYFCRLVEGKNAETKKILLLK